MKKIATILLVEIFSMSFNTPVYSKTINEADTELCETLKYAPSNLTWTSSDTEIIQIKQLYGISGAYEITLKVYPYYGAQMNYGIDEIVVDTMGS